jgi:hypothetical protein
MAKGIIAEHPLAMPTGSIGQTWIIGKGLLSVTIDPAIGITIQINPHPFCFGIRVEPSPIHEL